MALILCGGPHTLDSHDSQNDKIFIAVSFPCEVELCYKRLKGGNRKQTNIQFP